MQMQNYILENSVSKIKKKSISNISPPIPVIRDDIFGFVFRSIYCSGIKKIEQNFFARAIIQE